MALQTSGAISLNDMHLELGSGSGTQVSLNDSDIRDLIGKGSGAQMSFSEWYGAAATNAIASYSLDIRKHTSTGSTYVSSTSGRNFTGSSTGQLPSDLTTAWWPISDKPFDTIADSQMPTDVSYRTNAIAQANLPSNGAYANVGFFNNDWTGSISTGPVNGAGFFFRRSWLFPLNKILTGSHTISCKAYADFEGDTGLGTYRDAQIRVYVREFDTPTSIGGNSEYVQLSSKGTRHFIGSARGVYSPGNTISKTITTTKEYLCAEIWVETNSYSSRSVGARDWNIT